MELNINNIGDFVRNATILWMKARMSVPRQMRDSGMVKEIAIPQLTGNTREFSEIDLEEYASIKTESDQAARAKVQQGYTKTGTLYRVAKDIGISYEMRTQGKYYEIVQRLTNLGKLADNRMELDLSHRITFGTATTYTNKEGTSVDISVGDTRALFDTAHTLRGSSTTYRNRLANNPVVSRGALEAMELMRKQNTYNQFGEKMTGSDDIIWTTDDQNSINTVRELLRATTNPTQPNESVPNVYEGKYRHVQLDRVATDKNGGVDTTKQKYWGVASSEYSTLMLGVHEEPRMKAPPVEGSNAEEFSTDDWNFGVRGGWMIATVTAGWIGFSSGDGVA